MYNSGSIADIPIFAVEIISLGTNAIIPGRIYRSYLL